MNQKYKEIFKNQKFCILGNTVALKDKALYKKLVAALEEESSYSASENDDASLYIISAKDLAIEPNEKI